MKFGLWVVFASLVSIAASAAPARPLYWNELSEGQAVTLRQNLLLSDKVKFSTGTRLRVTMREALSGPAMSLTYFGLTQTPCTQPEWQEGLELVLPEGELDSTRSVGIELGKNCEWGIYVETKDLDAAGVFQE